MDLDICTVDVAAGRVVEIGGRPWPYRREDMDPITIAMGLAQFAPQIIKWVSGSDKAADAASSVVAIAQAVTGKVGPDVLTALSADPAMQLQFRTAVMATEAELDKAYLADRQDARRRDVELATHGAKNHRPDVLIGVSFLAVIVVAVLLGMGVISGDSAVGGFLLAIGARFAGNLDKAVDFEFGSSRGSKEKSEELTRMR